MTVDQRLQKLHRRLQEKGLDAILVSQPLNCRYLTGFTGSAATLIVSPGSAVLGTDAIHFEQAKAETTCCDVLLIRNRLDGLAELVRGKSIRALGVEADSLSYSEACRLMDVAQKLRLQIVPTEGLVQSVRTVKEDEEISHLSRAAAVADSACNYIADEIQPGMSEKETAWKLERFLRENGSEVVPFDLIVASGPNAALPHARPTERIISEGEPIVVDLGARVNGYTSDLTRTLCLGTPGDTFTKIYDLVLRAQLAALQKIAPGMTGEEADRFARQIVEDAGFGHAFGHGLGHGIGLDVHEEPALRPNSKHPLTDQMVFTVEPGVYLPGWGGVRIEDTAMLERGKLKTLTAARKWKGSLETPGQ